MKQNNPKSPVNSSNHSKPLWKQLLAGAVRDPAQLCKRLQISSEHVDLTPNFPLFVPEPYLNRIRIGDPRDPLLRQVLPTKNEANASPGFSTDPLEETGNLSPQGILSKYHGRSLIVAAKSCSVHCRFCFRRHWPGLWGAANSPSMDPAAIAAQFKADPTIHEAILSGGEPLMLSDDALGDLILHLDQIPTIQRIRIHTRMPITIPQRVTSQLLGIIKNRNRTGNAGKMIIVLHVNHPNEIEKDVVDAVTNLIASGCMVLSQTVLLNKVNDSLPVLAELLQCLINTGVIPYYLHQLDRVAGAAHFEVSPDKGRDLINKLRSILPGYAVPRYVKEIAGEPGKVVIG